VGFNPYRKYRANRTDYVLIGAVCAAAAGMLVWALFG
jgi:energy-coupling factor transporter transmembrane protein EcfT